MNINEIESTLQSLITRHPNLNEAMLTTLLASGGWDDKMIHDAILLFRSSAGKIQQTNSAPESFLPIEEENILPASTDEEHQLLEHNPDIESEEKSVPRDVSSEARTPRSVLAKWGSGGKQEAEPQSLITSTVTISQTKNVEESEPPHNLPLRPFETTEHIWPFSRYKDVFYGEVMPEIKDDEKELVENHKTEHIYIERTALTYKDEELIFLAGIMLVVIVILLFYMYSNGRL